MTIRKLLLGAAFALLTAVQAHAAAFTYCSPEQSVGAQARRIVVSSSTASPQPSYVLNGQGCALIQQADIGFFQSLGFTPGSNQNIILFTTGVATSTTDFVIGTLPAKAYIQQIIFSNSVAAAVTGGISIGTTANGTNIVAAQAVGSSTDVAVAQAAILLPVPVTTGLAAPLHMAAVTAWNSTNVTVSVIYGYY